MAQMTIERGNTGAWPCMVRALVKIFHGENGAQDRNRTSDTRIFNPLLYQLSYLGTRVVAGV